MYHKAMQSRAFVSVGEYLATSYQPDFEYVDGQLLERNLGERVIAKCRWLSVPICTIVAGNSASMYSLSKGFRCQRLDSAFRISA